MPQAPIYPNEWQSAYTLTQIHDLNAKVINDHITPDGYENSFFGDTGKEKFVGRAGETGRLLKAVESLLLPFIADADNENEVKGKGAQGPLHSNSKCRTTLVERLEPLELIKRIGLRFPEHGGGSSSLLALVSKILQYSTNTWDQGFMDKLYSSTTPVGVASELILAVLNTQVHVYQVSPALSVIERQTGEKLANMFGLTGPYAGGISQPGGSASNLTSVVIARNTLFPECKTQGSSHLKLVIFTSYSGHYSVEKAAQLCGLGSEAVWNVPVQADGQMDVSKLQDLIQKAREEGKHPFYVNATAGTTVVGAYDPLDAIADICEREGLWMHVDGSLGGGAIFSKKQRHKLHGSARARSITINPHKMLGAPVTCSFLLASNLHEFWRSNTLPANYLFHQPLGGEEAQQHEMAASEEEEKELPWDLADLTLQCGRKGDSLKLALAWAYHGSLGYEVYVDAAFNGASYLASLVQKHPRMSLAPQTNPPQCVQVCLYYLASGCDETSDSSNTRTTRTIAARLPDEGFMVDFAPGPRGKFLRVVVNGQTSFGTLECLINKIDQIGLTI